MGIRIKSLSNKTLVLPEPLGGVLDPWSEKTFPFVESDACFNEPRILKLVNAKPPLLALYDLDTGEIIFSDEWDSTERLTVGDRIFWINTSGQLVYKDGEPTSDSDGTPVSEVSAGVKAEPVQTDVMPTSSRSFASVRSNFFNWLRNRTMTDYSSYYQYCYWQMRQSNGAVEWSPLTQYATTDDLFTAMETIIPSSGSAYTENTEFRIIDLVDQADSWPNKLIHRNSLVASMRGRNNWGHSNFKSGVDYNFNAPQYYLNFYDELGQRFVEQHLSILPATNNDGCVWYQNNSRTLWHWPIVGSVVDIPPSARGAVWDSTINNWVNPAPQNSYVIQPPFWLTEMNRQKFLTIETSGPDVKRPELAGVTALVFPLVAGGRYHAFLVCPHNGDSFFTDKFDTGDYATILKMVFPGSRSPTYEAIDPWPTVIQNAQTLCWSYFDPIVGNNLLFRVNDNSFMYRQPIATNRLPSTVYVSRRHLTSGQRSPWKLLYRIKRGIANANFRIEPAYKV